MTVTVLSLLQPLKDRLAAVKGPWPASVPPTDQAKLIAAIEGAEQSFIGRAESYRETADRLNQQVIDRDPDRDPEAAARYSYYASAAESALQVFRIAITQALEGGPA